MSPGLVFLAVAASLAAAPLAPAARAASFEPPLASADARLGTLHVTSGIVVTAKAADLRGVWQDSRLPCTVSRRLVVRVQVYLTLFGRTGTRRARTGSFRTPNCAEGGPNVGFTLSARKLGYACPDGRWRPGRLSFVVTTTEPTRGLRATASLGWSNTRAC